MSKRRRSPPRDEVQAKGVSRTGYSRRTLLGALGVGSILPAMQASGQEKDREKAFDEYWLQVEADIRARDAEKDLKKRERMDVKIEFRRRDIMLILDRSASFNAKCPKVTPTAGVSKQK